MYRILLAVCLLAFAGCADQVFVADEDSGSILNSPIESHTMTLSIDSSTVVHHDINTGLSPYFLLGEHNGLKTSALLRFNSVDELFPSAQVVTGAILVMTPQFNFGNYTAVMEGTLHLVQTEWDEFELPEVTIGEAFSSFELTEAGILTDTLSIPIEIIETWLSEPDSNWGIYLNPTNDLVAKQYNSVSNSSSVALIVYYDNGENSGNISAPVTEDAYLIEGELNTTSELYVASAYPHKAVIKFNVDELPVNATINYAELVLPIDPGPSELGSRDTYSFTANQVLMSDWASDSLSFDANQVRLATIEGLIEIRFNISNMVQNWISGLTDGQDELLYPNHGILLSIGEQNQDMSQIMFYDNASPFKPQLIIDYTIFELGK